MKGSGYTIGYYDIDDGRPRVAGRFKTEDEKDKFLSKIYQPDSGWLDEELELLFIVPDYNYALPY